MLITTLGWALVALAVAVVFVPILYAVHLVVLHERLRHHALANIASVAIRAGVATSCPYCGEPVSSSQLAYETLHTGSAALAT
ncbi:MAG: hypothetical protein WCA31_12245 [Acidimicrobiales bacterium]